MCFTSTLSKGLVVSSTAVPGIWAKDIVDVLVEISTDSIECIAIER